MSDSSQATSETAGRVGVVETHGTSIEEAISIARLGEEKNDIDASSVLSGIAQDLALAGALARAREVAGAIKLERKRRKALIRVDRMALFTQNAKAV